MKKEELICDFSILRDFRKRLNMSIAELAEKAAYLQVLFPNLNVIATVPNWIPCTELQKFSV